jgi:hypothetical protein
MPITLSYDLENIDPNGRNYVRSMLERFGWQRRGGSTFRYIGREHDEVTIEDWLNDVAPSLMYLRSYVLSIGASFKFFTIDAQSTSILDHSDPTATLGWQPTGGNDLELREPTNNQSSVQRIRDFVNAATTASTAHPENPH